MNKIIYGFNKVSEAIKNDALIEKVYFSEKLNFKPTNAIKFQKITSEKMNEMTNTNSHEGICAKVYDFKYHTFTDIQNDSFSKVLILDHIIKNQNLGAIIRSANAFGVSHIFIPNSKESANVTFETFKASRGGLNNLKIVKVESLSDVINFLKSKGLTTYVTALDNSAKELGNFKINKQFALVVGNEANGVSAEIIALADEIVFIKMFGTVQSLNVGVAAGIALFELTKTSD